MYKTITWLYKNAKGEIFLIYNANRNINTQEYKYANLAVYVNTRKSKGYITCKFSTRIEIHPEQNSTMPTVKALFVVTCWGELKF